MFWHIFLVINTCVFHFNVVSAWFSGILSFVFEECLWIWRFRLPKFLTGYFCWRIYIKTTVWSTTEAKPFVSLLWTSIVSNNILLIQTLHKIHTLTKQDRHNCKKNTRKKTKRNYFCIKRRHKKHISTDRHFFYCLEGLLFFSVTWKRCNSTDAQCTATCTSFALIPNTEYHHTHQENIQ